MPFYREGIEEVRALALPDGIAADGSPACLSSAWLVTWRSTHAEKLHQVYLEGCLAGVTLDRRQRQLVVRAPGSFHSALRVEVVAVAPEDACVDFAESLDPPPGRGRVVLSLLRSQTLPSGSWFNIYCDNGTGQVNYAKPLNAWPIPVWPYPQDKAGFGTSRFGEGDFGRDSAASVGFGKGSFTNGPFGMDADAISWLSPLLPLGRYRFGVKTVDSYGNESVACEAGPVTVVPPATPVAGLRVVGLDPNTNQLTLRICDQ